MKTEGLRTRTPPFWFALFPIPWLLLASSSGQIWSLAQDREIPGSAPFRASRSSGFHETCEVGDFYSTPTGRHPLLRLLGDGSKIVKAAPHPRVHSARPIFV